MKSDLNPILKQFLLNNHITPYGDGHINRTYITDDGQYILQTINTDVFKNPDKLMDNICAVTAHLCRKIEAEGRDVRRETLSLVPTADGKLFYRDADGNCYRVYQYIADSLCYSVATDPELLYQAGKAFGRFQTRLNDFPMDQLYETIPDFHDTPKRFGHLQTAIQENRSGRLHTVEKEVAFALSQESFTSRITDALKEGSIPLRVTHNDTKINNVLFDKNTREALCVIDLDTVMPGSLLYDYGDALRTAAASAAEDEKDLDKMFFKMDSFSRFTEGYLEELLAVMTPREIELLTDSVKMMTYECGIRFLSDYLNGDTYFKTAYPTHNLDRARTQFKLFTDIEKKTPAMNAEIDRIIRKIRG